MNADLVKLLAEEFGADTLSLVAHACVLRAEEKRGMALSPLLGHTTPQMEMLHAHAGWLEEFADLMVAAKDAQWRVAS